MPRTPFAAFGLLFLTLLTVPLSAADRPNVVLVITDDQGYGDVGAHGNSMIQTPNLDKLYAESIRLTDFHVDPTCSPTRSALMSGRYSTRTGVWHTIMGRSLMNARELTIAEVFHANGYRTGMFGKWHLGENYPCRPQDQGFDEAFYHGGGGVGQGPDYFGNDYFDDTYFRNGKPEKVKGYCTDVWFRNAMSFIAKNREKPFFVYLATNAPHGPYLVDKKYSDPYRQKGVPNTMANFYGMITNIDENVARLRQHLRKLKLEKNTLFIFMTDNGSAAGWRARGREKGSWRGFNAGMRAGKGSEYDGGHRVPFFAYWPDGKLVGPRDVNQLSAHIDVLPTLVDLCGLKKPKGPRLDGVSLSAALRGNRDVLRDRTLLVHSQRIPYPQKWRKSAVMTERWRLINGKELYDIQADPGQRKDVFEKHPEVVSKLTAAYNRWWESLKPGFDKFVRIGLGSPQEPRAQLHPHDWHVRNQSLSSWHQNHVRSGHLGRGFWAVNVLKPGKYRVELRRWPDHQDRPLEAVEARLRIADQDAQQKTDPKDTKVVFEVELPAGPTRLEALLKTPEGKVRGAYFVYVERVGSE